MRALTVLSLLLVAVTLGLSLAHALGWPGKLRLDEAAYKTTQAIYYPGFTFGGLVGELYIASEVVASMAQAGKAGAQEPEHTR